MKKQKLLSLLLAILLTAPFLSACSGNEDGTLNFSSSSADTLDGGTFTQEDIAAKDVTAINFWGTFCGPCIGEMPDLAAFEKALPDNVQLITICLDAQGNEDTAKALLAQAGFEGVTLISGDNKFNNICRPVTAVPITVFVDSKGKQVGDKILGAQPDLSEQYLKAINEALAKDGKAEISLEK